MTFVVVDPERMKKYSEETGKEINEALYASDELKSIVLKDFTRLANENNFNGLEKPKQIMLLEEQFTGDNGLLTPTMKLKRNFAKVYFKE